MMPVVENVEPVIEVASTCRQHIIDKSVRVLQRFVHELALGTTQYRSLHNLTEQVEHQYHDRFLVELIQNAHDALLHPDIPATNRRIEIRIQKSDDCPFGALYVANDGLPFSLSNFNSLSELGQSDKDPNESIGNKGIGFRSVLQICDSPEIYSREKPESEFFDGFCFKFHPEVIEKFEFPIQKLLDGQMGTFCPFSNTEKLLPGADELYPKLRSNNSQKKDVWLKDELKYLSPYLFPVPINVNNPIVKEFERAGYATVVRLPFLDKNAYRLAIEKLVSLPNNMVLFLDRVEILTLAAGDQKRTFSRIEDDLRGDPEHGREILISIKNDVSGNHKIEESEYWLWQETYGGEDEPEEREKVKTAVATLPGKWPNMRKAKASFAVRKNDEPELGCLNIYLPTKMPSGCHAHFSAPFYGDINRTGVDFEQEYNQLLLEIIASKTIKVIKNFLSDKGSIEASVIVDLLSPVESTTGDQWWDCVQEAAGELEVDLYQDRLCLTDKDWQPFGEARILAEVDNRKYITDAVLRQHIDIPILIDELLIRHKQLIQLYKSLSFEILIDNSTLAATVEKIVKVVHREGGIDWNIIWEDIKRFFPSSSKPLEGKKVLLGIDNQLHASGGRTKVFFRPVRSGPDSDVTLDRSFEDIPVRLQAFIAFLHADIVTHTPGDAGGLRNTPVQKYLADDLVEAFQVQEIVQGVILRHTPKDFPVEYKAPKSLLCQALFQWGLKLSYSLIEQGKGENITKLLGRLPVPCLGGWYPLGVTSFGPGWEKTMGSNLYDYLSSIKSPECHEARNRLLKFPNDPLWEGLSEKYQSTLSDAGVFDGLRLLEIKPDTWKSTFSIKGWEKISLSGLEPPGLPEHFWKEYNTTVVEKIETYFTGKHLYRAQKYNIFPGINEFCESDEKSKILLTTLILSSIDRWSGKYSWKQIELKKEKKQHHSYKLKSPLVVFLETEKWIHDQEDEGTVAFRPSEKWYINSHILSGRTKQFAHLKPYPLKIRRLLEGKGETVSALQSLGMPVYKPNELVSDCRLLNALASAFADPDVEIVNQSVFLGQLREAWKQFHPKLSLDFPNKLIVKQGRRFTAINKGSGHKIFLPNDSPAIHYGLELATRSIVVIDPREAKRLQDQFKDAFGGDIILASELKMLPVIDGQSVEWPIRAGQPPSESNLDWLPPVVLVVFAFAGEQSYGTATKTFAEAIDRLHELQIIWVDSLELGLWQEDECITNVPLERSAIKVPKKRVIISVKENKYSIDNLADVLSSIVNRNDLELPLKFVLSKLKEATPDLHNIESVLAELHITRDQIDEVQQLWLGDISWTIRLLTPILSIIDPDVDIPQLLELNSADALLLFLKELQLGSLSADQLLSEARRAGSFKSIGEWLYNEIGDNAQLNKFNSILLKLSFSIVKNDVAKEEFNEHLSDMRSCLQGVVRRILLDSSDPGSFIDFTEKLLGVSFPINLETEFWTVPFNKVAIQAAEVIRTLGASKLEIEAVSSAMDLAGLEKNLSGLGIKINEDFNAIHSHNYDAYRKDLLFFQRVSTAWCLKNDTPADAPMLQISNRIESLSDELDPYGYLEIWSPERCLAEIQKSEFDFLDEFLKSSLAKINDLGELPTVLGLMEDDLNRIDDDLEEQKRKKARVKRLVDIGGSTFDSASDNLTGLWQHIEKNIHDDNIPTLNLSRAKQLHNLTKKTINGKGKGGNGSGTIPRMSGDMKNLLGLAGEIFVYKSLEKEFGKSIVTSECWVSENAKYRFPGNKEVSDSIGCDFILKIKGTKHYIEVKATQGENTAFELGSSEVRRAIDVARRGNAGKYLILHVIGAFSKSPSIRTLPNPYHKDGAKKYNVGNKGLRMTYKMKKGD